MGKIIDKRILIVKSELTIVLSNIVPLQATGKGLFFKKKNKTPLEKNHIYCNGNAAPPELTIGALKGPIRRRREQNSKAYKSQNSKISDLEPPLQYNGSGFVFPEISMTKLRLIVVKLLIWLYLKHIFKFNKATIDPKSLKNNSKIFSL